MDLDVKMKAVMLGAAFLIVCANYCQILVPYIAVYIALVIALDNQSVSMVPLLGLLAIELS